MGSTLPSHGHKRCVGAGKFWGSKQGYVPRGTLSSYCFTKLDICQGIALHNVSYKGHVRL
jgi:hypothetical protein